METKILKRANIALVLILAVLIFVTMFAFLLKTPLYKDDYSYSYTFAVKDNKFPIENFSQVIESQINHYKVMNGRAIVHTLLQTFLMWGKPVYNYIGAVAFAVFCVYLSRLGAGRVSAIGTVFVFGILWLFAPRFGESFLWVSGACNYLIGPLISFLFLLPAFRALEARREYAINTKIILFPLWICFGIAAGMTCENAAASLLIMELMLTAVITVRRKKLPVMLFCGFIASIVGCILLVKSPGEGVRLAAYGGVGSIADIIGRAFDISGELLKICGLPIAATFAFTALGIMRCGVKTIENELIRTAVLFVGALAATYSMILAPYFPGRAWSVPLVLYAAAFVSAYTLAFEKTNLKFRIILSSGLAAVLCMFALFCGVHGYSALSKTYMLDEERRAVIECAKRDGISEVSLDTIAGNSRFDPYDEHGDLSPDKNSWPNTAIAMYYGLDFVNMNQAE